MCKPPSRPSPPALASPVVRLALIASRLWCEVGDIRVMAAFAGRGPLKGHTAEALAPLRHKIAAAVSEGAEAGSVRRDIPVARLARLAEDAALSALAEASSDVMSGSAAHRLVMLLVLATVGLSAAQAAALIDTPTELDWTDS